MLLVMKLLLKWFARNTVINIIVCWLIALYIRLVWHSSRWEVRGDQKLQKIWHAGHPAIVGFWHGRLLLMPYVWNQNRPSRMLVSTHRDGQLIARIMAHFNIKTIEGSTANKSKQKNKGGVRAYREILRDLKKGGSIGITPDGPRGPCMRVNGAIINAAQHSGAPIFSCAIATNRRLVLSSWDRFQLALPWSKGVVLWSEPLIIPPDADREQARIELQAMMIELSQQADRFCGHIPIEPDVIEDRCSESNNSTFTANPVVG